MDVARVRRRWERVHLVPRPGGRLLDVTLDGERPGRRGRSSASPRPPGPATACRCRTARVGASGRVLPRPRPVKPRVNLAINASVARASVCCVSLGSVGPTGEGDRTPMEMQRRRAEAGTRSGIASCDGRDGRERVRRRRRARGAAGRRCPSSGRATCSSRCRTAASAAPTCTSCSSRSRGPGTVLGHEWAGTIAALGDDVDGLGGRRSRRVRADARCGECRACRRGRPSVCLRREPPDHLDFRGAFAGTSSRRRSAAARCPRHCRSVRAALTEPTAIALHTVTLSGVTPDDRVLVTGAGPVGLLVDRGAARAGVNDITVSEPSPVRRRACARRSARRAVVDPTSCRARRWARRSTSRTRSCSSARARADAAESALDQLDFAGTLRVRRHRPRPAPHQPQPRDRARAHDHRCVQLRRRRVRARARAARVGRAAARRADRADRRRRSTSSRRRHATLAAGRAPRQGDGPTVPFGGDSMSEVAASQPTFAPRLNHVAITMPPGRARRRRPCRDPRLLRRRVRLDRGRQQRRDGEPAHPHDRADAVRVPAARRPALECPRLDHFGLEVSTVEEIDAIVAKAKAWQEKDDRVQIIDIDARVVGGAAGDYTLTSAYIGFLLPMMVELQHLHVELVAPPVSVPRTDRGRLRTGRRRPIPIVRRWSPGRDGGRTPSSTALSAGPRTRRRRSACSAGDRVAGCAAERPRRASSPSTARCGSARCGSASTAPWRRRRSSTCSTTVARRCCSVRRRDRGTGVRRCGAHADRRGRAGGVARCARSRARRAAHRDIDPFAPAAIAYTSGTTGYPKGACTASTTCCCPAPCSARARGCGPTLRKGDFLAAHDPQHAGAHHVD